MLNVVDPARDERRFFNRKLQLYSPDILCNSESVSEIDSNKVLSENVLNLPIFLSSPLVVALGVEETRLYFSSNVLMSCRNCDDPEQDPEDSLEDDGNNIEISVD